MKDFLMNPWTITIVGGLAVLVVAGIWSSVFKKKKTNGPVAILNKGKNTKILNNTFEGFDVAIKNEGENLHSEGNEFKK